MMKKAISLMLALVLVVSLCGSALAATVSPSVSKTTVAAGESVDVTLTLSEKLENIYGMYYYLSFDEDLFELTGDLGSSVGTYSHGMKQKLSLIAALRRKNTAATT